MTLVMSVTNTLLPLLYLLVFGTYLWLFRSDNPTPQRVASRLAAAVVLLHLAEEM